MADPPALESRLLARIHRLLESETGQRAIGDMALDADCVAHARMFFNRPATVSAGSGVASRFSIRLKSSNLRHHVISEGLPARD